MNIIIKKVGDNMFSKTRNLVIALAIVAGIIVASWGAAFAISSFYKQLTGIGNVEFNQEVTVSNIQVTGSDKIKVSLTSSATTIPATTYTVTLYLDYASESSYTISWSAAEIPGTIKRHDFTGLSLASVSNINVEVTR